MPEPFGPVTSTKPPRSTSSSSPSKIRFCAVALREAARADHDSASASTNTKNDDADDAVHREERGVEAAQVARRDERVLDGEQDGDDAATPSQYHTPSDRPTPTSASNTTVRRVQQARAPEDAADAEARRHRMEPLATVDVHVEQRVEEVEAGDPAATAPPSSHASSGSVPVIATHAPIGASPSTAPSQRWQSHVHALQVRVDDEADRPGSARASARRRFELEDRDEEDDERRDAEERDLRAREQPRRQLARRGARIARVELGVDQPVQPHRERARADHRDGDPEQVVRRRDAVDREQRADVRERQREERVLDLHEPREAQREHGGRARHVCRCAVDSLASSRSACSSAGRSTA